MGKKYIRRIDVQAIDYARQACDTMMRRFPEAPMLEPKGIFRYHQGVFLSGMLNVYEVCKDEKYYNYVKEWVDSFVDEDGTLHGHDPEMFDDLQPGILLYPLYRRTGDRRYRVAMDTIIEILRGWKCNPSGGFWHKMCHPDQMWLDSLYMSGPIQVEYGQMFGDDYFFDIITKQVLIMYENMKDERSGLLCHAWDESKKEKWADKETGKSPEVWGRALGWYVVAILDVLSFIPEDHENRQKIIEIEKEVLAALVKYQDTNGLWYQVVPKPDGEGNWHEVSCSSLFTYALAKAVRMGVVGEEYRQYAEKGFVGVIETLEYEGDDLIVGKVCMGTGVSDYDYYINRPIIANDLHGMGAFLLMCAEMAR